MTGMEMGFGAVPLTPVDAVRPSAVANAQPDFFGSGVVGEISSTARS